MKNYSLVTFPENFKECARMSIGGFVNFHVIVQRSWDALWTSTSELGEESKEQGRTWNVCQKIGCLLVSIYTGLGYKYLHPITLPPYKHAGYSASTLSGFMTPTFNYQLIVSITPASNFRVHDVDTLYHWHTKKVPSTLHKVFDKRSTF